MNKLTDSKIIIVNGIDVDKCTDIAWQVACDNDINLVNSHFILNETYKMIKEAKENESSRADILLQATFLYNSLFNIPYIICAKNLFSSCVTNPVLSNDNPKYALHTNINKFIRNWQRRLLIEGLKKYPDEPIVFLCPYEYKEMDGISSNMLSVWVNNEKDGEYLKKDTKADDYKLKQNLLQFKLNADYVFNESVSLLSKRVEEFINEQN